MVNYYQVLKVSPQASLDEIRKAFRQEAKRCHPDLYHNASTEEKQKLQKQFVLLTQAYEHLSDPNRRSAYDRQFKQSHQQQKKQTRTHASYTKADTFHSSTHTRSSSPPFEDSSDETLEDLLNEVEELFSRFGVGFRDPLQVLVDWALKIFTSVNGLWDEERNTFKSTKNKEKVKSHSIFEEIEDEFQHLKSQYKTTSHSNAKKSKTQQKTKNFSNNDINQELHELKKKYGKFR
ncbi:MAG: J domain-containing protein [SAR324 cluster bacterium]|nr:J domain-containing protein [SAR324 cluster bacterium]